MLSDFLRALGQLGDARFLRVVVLGIGLALALLAGVYAGFLALIEWATPGSVSIPWIGPVGGIDTLLSWGSLVLMLGLSVFLMVPVASAFSGLFLDDVAQAVEDRHYPGLPPAPRVPLTDSLIDSANFFGVLVVVNLLALVVFAFTGPLIPLFFWAINGFLLGREYFTLVATRRLGRAGAKALRAAYPLQIWLAGTLMAAPLSIPLVNLVVPVLGVATFTHMFHRLTGQRITP
ncbi:EI24 domain-containing protein [Fuscibacter oryzae]|uniref:EI24 domain-containing protein n=1 Tax=Fuscibacter oryzae TaxID=2803939 RepID=A0A8J7MM20_9RHOB|nr:EI24 domain-containing protein [Fuscibacter oryzae]MBL4927300.1 EI24 domain-containing protein [Fuscibacter oryzae]